MKLIELLSFFGAMSSADLLAATQLEPEDLKKQLESLLESEKVDLHITATGTRYWRLPGANEVPEEKLAKLFEIARRMDSGFTPSSLHREQLIEVGIAREQVKAFVDKWHAEGKLKAIGDKRVMGKSWTVFGVADQDYDLIENDPDVIINFLRSKSDPMSAVGIAKGSGLTRYRTSKALEILLKQNQVTKLGERYSIPGRGE